MNTRTIERGKRYESFASSLGRIAYAYGFTGTPAVMPKKSLGDSSDVPAQKVAASLSLLKQTAGVKTPTSLWGSARMGSKGTMLTFAIVAARHAVSHALVVKTAVSIAELSGFTDIAVLVSSVGDNESRKRFTKELGNFFKKNAENVREDIRHIAASDPDKAYRALIASKDPILEKAPRTMDYLSENSRKTMLDTLSLFESVGIPYTLDARLSSTDGVHTELLFAVEGADKSGERVRIAAGGRFDEHMKKERGSAEPAVSMSIQIPQEVDPEACDEEPSCFIVHVGDVAKLRAFTILESMWRANLLVGEALMAESLRDQMQKAAEAKTRYVAIIGQREALDGTVIVRNLETQLQTTIPLDKFPGHIGRTRTR
jgi:histidyl-tRNA synthetase